MLVPPSANLPSNSLPLQPTPYTGVSHHWFSVRWAMTLRHGGISRLSPREIPAFFCPLSRKYSGISLCPATCYAFASGLANNLVPILSSRPPPLVMLSRFRPREIPLSTIKIALKAIFICIYAKIIVSLHPQFHAGDVCASSAGVADILKRRLLTLCSGELKLRNFQIVFRT